MGGTGQKWAQLFGPLYTHCMQFPYAHRLESGNIPFQNIQKIFTGLENAFAVLGAPWKPHKSKVQTILPARNIHEKFITPKIKIFFLDRKKIGKKMLKKNLRTIPGGNRRGGGRKIVIMRTF